VPAFQVYTHRSRDYGKVCTLLILPYSSARRLWHWARAEQKGAGHVDGVIAEVGQPQILQQPEGKLVCAPRHSFLLGGWLHSTQRPKPATLGGW
jgi:hypothetical protein